MTWKIECSIGGAFAPGSGLRYNEMMVMPFENCSARARQQAKYLDIEYSAHTDIFPRRVEGVEVV